MLVGVGKFVGYSRDIVVIACYLPPNLATARAASGLNFIRGAVIGVKRKLDDPYIIISGDFNQWKIDETLEDFPDLLEANVGPTRGTR